MIQKIKAWWKNRKLRGIATSDAIAEERGFYTREQMEKVYYLGYNDGKRDGLNIARVQATNSLKEILWQQNQKKNS